MFNMLIELASLQPSPLLRRVCCCCSKLARGPLAIMTFKISGDITSICLHGGNHSILIHAHGRDHDNPPKSLTEYAGLSSSILQAKALRSDKARQYMPDSRQHEVWCKRIKSAHYHADVRLTCDVFGPADQAFRIIRQVLPIERLDA